MAKTTKNVTEEIVEKSEVAVEAVEVAPEAVAVAEATEAVEAAVAKSDTEKAVMPSNGKEDAEEDAEESTEKAEKPMTDEEIAAAKEAEAMKPMAPKSDEVAADADNSVDLNQAFSDLVSTVKSLQAEVELLKSSKVDVDEVKNSFEAVAKDIAAASNVFNEFGKRVDAVEADTAFRKSGDLGEIVQNQPETVEKSLWGGSFLKTADLFN